MYRIRTVFAIGFAGIMVDDAEALHTFHNILEIDVMIVALALACTQFTVFIILHTSHETGTLDGMTPLGESRASRW